MASLKITHDITRRIHFIGILANTDVSIKSVGLGKNFHIESMSDVRAVKLLAEIENLPLQDSQWKLLYDHWCTNTDERKCYFVNNSFDVIEDHPDALFEAVGEFNRTHVQDYLEPTIKQMRLFKKGNICMPLRYYYYLDEEERARSCGWGGIREMVLREPFTLSHAEISEMEAFLKKRPLMSQETFVRLAVDFFDQSYQSGNRSVVFSLLMNCLLTLFDHDDGDELQLIAPRNAAVFLGEDVIKAKNINRDVEHLMHKNMKQLKLGSKKIITKMDVIKARTYARESIKEAMSLGLDKEGLTHLLRSSGFGKRTWKDG